MSKSPLMQARLVAVAAAALVALSSAASIALPAGGTAFTAGTAGKSAWPGTAPADAHVRRPAIAPLAARALGPSGELRGMSLNDVGWTARSLSATIPDFPRMAAEGITSVTAYVYLYVQDPWSNDVSTGLNTPPDAELDAVAQAAHANGMQLQLMPVLLDVKTNRWRGYYVPSDIPAFFASYTTAVLHYADLAQRDDATLFYIGSENERLVDSRFTAYWRAVAASVRQHFHGALSYMATPGNFPKVTFWDAVDLASVSPYFALSDEDNPSYDRFMAAWREVNMPIVQKLAARARKPLIYGEIGYNSQQHAFANPSANPPATKLPAPAAQADAYRALLDVLRDTPYVYGAAWFRWAPGTTPLDTSFSPNGKPAECVIAAHWSQNSDVRSAASTPTCDLHALDQALATAGTAVPKR